MPADARGGEKNNAWRARLAALGWTAAWAYAIVAGGGGLWLLLTKGPLPLTNGWFALFSGVAACPATATLLKRCLGIAYPARMRAAAAFLFWVAGRIALAIGV
jgi:hypothetical protein